MHMQVCIQHMLLNRSGDLVKSDCIVHGSEQHPHHTTSDNAPLLSQPAQLERRQERVTFAIAAAQLL
jgi:hypothetical protein